MKQENDVPSLGYVEKILYYLFHPVRAVLFYLGFTMVSNASIFRLPNSDPEMADYIPWVFHFCASLTGFISFALLAGLFTLYDATARRRFILTQKPLVHTFSEHIGVLGSFDFWCDAASFLIMPLVYEQTIFIHPLNLIFGRETFPFWQSYVGYLLLVLPILMLIDVLFRVRVRGFWRELTYEDACAMRFDILKLIGLFYLVLVGYVFLSGFYLPGLAFLLRQFLNPSVLIVAAAIVLLISSFWYLRAFFARKRFWKLLKKTCRENGYELSKIRAPYRSLFTKNGKYEFTVKAHGKTYACKMLACVNRGADMIFFSDGEGVCRKVMKVRGVELPFKTYNKKFRYDFDCEGADAKVLILSPSPLTPYVEEGGRKYILDNGSIFHDYFLYAGQGFVNALNRNCVGVWR